MNEKSQIRNNVQMDLQALTNDEYVQLSKQISNHLFSSSFWLEAQVIALTISREREVDTEQIINHAWKQGKKIVIPRADFIHKTMTFYELTSYDQLEKGSFGLVEPIPSKCRIVDVDDFDLVVVPGLAFTAGGYRLGFGGGFYDRLLPVRATTISLAFPCQMVQSLPTEEHDQKVEYVLGPNGFYR